MVFPNRSTMVFPTATPSELRERCARDAKRGRVRWPGRSRTWSRHGCAAGVCGGGSARRAGSGGVPPLPRGDFEAEAPLFAELLGNGAHLVGHSYGAVIALYAAALRPDAVLSLTVSEPGCLRVAAGDPRVDAPIPHGGLLYGQAGTPEPLEFPTAVRGWV